MVESMRDVHPVNLALELVLPEIIWFISVVFCRRLRWDAYCRNDPNEYRLELKDVPRHLEG